MLTLSVNDFIKYSLDEDIGSGDITTNFIVDKDIKGEGIIVAKEKTVIAGLNVVKKVFETLDNSIEFFFKCSDGDVIEKNEIILKVIGNINTLLIGERTALNFLQKLSGIATKTREYIKVIGNSKARLIDTRKTSPCLRILEKYAVRVGGGKNHRMGLYDGILIKDNHINISGGILQAVEKVRNKKSHLIKIEVEVSSIDEVKEALDAKVDVIMLDNMNLDEMKESVKIIKDKAIIEVSGGININNIKNIANLGVDYISVGDITHSAISVDLSMKINSISN